MSAEQIALLVGLLGAPAALLWLGHRMQRRTSAQRGAFWGGVIGHSAAVLPVLIALMYPPVAWTGGAALRGWVVHWALPLGALGGALLGAAVSRRRPFRRRPPPPEGRQP